LRVAGYALRGAGSGLRVKRCGIQFESFEVIDEIAR
jgi:hypothetical protein